MKTKVYLLAVVVFSVILTGCNSNRVDLTEDKNLVMDVKQGRTTRILGTNVYQDGEDFVVYGSVKRNGIFDCKVDTQVDIKVYSPEDKLLFARSTEEFPLPMNTPKRSIKTERFRESFSGELPDNSRVVLTTR